MPPPHPLGLPLEESVKVVPSSNTVCRCADPPPFVPVTYVAKAPISNSFPLKHETGGGGGAITSFEDTIGSPAKTAVACAAIVSAARVINLFIRLACFIVDCVLWILGIWLPAVETVDKWRQIPYPKTKCIILISR